MTNTQIAAFRLQNQRITHPAPCSAREVVAWHGAMQAQDYTHAKWAVGLRLPGSTDTAIEQAIERGEIIRTHVLRPTWHLAAPEDLRWMLALSAPQVKGAAAATSRQIGLDESVFSKTNDLLAKALQGGRYLTRAELVAELERSGITADNLQAAHIMMWAELDAVVCNGPRRGKQITYALLDERVPPGVSLDRRDAGAELARRYFTSHAPATLADFQWWSGLRAGEAREALEAIKHLLVSETLEGQTYWLPQGFRPAPAPAQSVHLLPAFDEFLVSYKDRSASLDSSRKAQTITGNGIFKPVVVVNGRVKGIWSRAFKKDKVLIEKEFYEEMSAAEMEGLEAAVRRFEAFAGA